MDLQIVGAGPAGCFAAREAAKSNINVVLMEEHNKVGIPSHCSGHISKEGLESLGIDYKKTVLNKLCGANIYSPDLNEIKIRANKVKSLLLDRVRFDQLCAEDAVVAGAKILLGVRAEREKLNGKIIIGADGFNSSIARWFNFPKINKFVFSYQADFENVKIEDKRIVSIFLSNKFSPGFFSWIIPINETDAKVGLGIWVDTNKPVTSSAKHYFDLFTKKHPIASKLLKNSKILNQSSFCIPMQMRMETVRANVMLIGDAAGQTKSTTGGGVVFGSLCAKIAGRTAAKNLQRGVSLNEYEKEWRKKFEIDLLLHQKMRMLYNSLNDSMISLYFKFAKRINIDKFLIEHGDMDKPTVMLDALKYLPKPLIDIIKNAI